MPKADNDNLLKVERVGGLAGFSLPGSHLKSAGEVLLSELSVADRKALEALFAGRVRKPAVKPDAFTYRMTRQIGAGAKTIEVGEDQVPLAIRNCVKDRLD